MEPSRAKNAEPRLTGDPERWGANGTGALVFPATAGPPITKTVETQQLLRAETRDLVAIGWDLLVVSTVTGLHSGDAGILALEITIGTGQANSLFLMLCGAIVAGALLPQNAAAAAVGFSPRHPNQNVAVSGYPLVATSLSARVILELTNVSGAAHSVLLNCNAHCAPRSWVP